MMLERSYIEGEGEDVRKEIIERSSGSGGRAYDLQQK